MIAAFRGPRGAALVLTLLCAGFGTILHRELSAAEVAAPIPPAAAPAHAAPLRPGTPSARLPPLARYAEVVRRPLFSRTRRPAPVNAAETLGAAGDFVLVGVVIDGSRREALIRHGRPGVLARLAVGQSVEGWTLRSVVSDRVVLAHGATRHELSLKDHPSARTPSRHR